MRKSLKSEQAKLTQIGQLFLFTGMITMLLLMTTNTMTPLLEEFNMKVMSHTGGLHNILRYEKNLPIRPPVQEDHVIEALAAVHGGHKMYTLTKHKTPRRSITKLMPGKMTELLMFMMMTPQVDVMNKTKGGWLRMWNLMEAQQDLRDHQSLTPSTVLIIMI